MKRLLSTAHFLRKALVPAAFSGLISGWLACAAPAPNTEQISAAGSRHGGRLVVALRAEPRTFNPVLAADSPSRTVIRRLTADLIHTNRRTLASEPALAESWTASPDGRRFSLELRRGVRFSDGEPFDAADVVFTFQVYLDEEIASANRNLLIVGGEPIEVEKTGSHSLELRLAEPYAVGVRLFDSIAILPRHRLEKAYLEGRFTETWGLAAAPEDLVGLGPFRLRRHVPGERLELERNPFYWKTDDAGEKLPYLDELTFLFVPSEDARVVRFQSGETHLINRLSAASFNLLERPPDGGYQLRDLGPGWPYGFLFFNLNETQRTWFSQTLFRRAVSRAIDRQAIVRVVYQNRATPIASHISPGNELWAHPGLEPSPHSPREARALLGEAGFSWDGEGRLRDAAGQAVEFSIVTNSGNDERVGMATLIQEDLRRIGIGVNLVTLEFRALLDRLLNTFEYEACVLSLSGGSDPNEFINVWRSDGDNHLWRMGQAGPATPWEAELDRLMLEQVTAIDHGERKRIYDRVQEILATEEPYILLVSPNVLVGASRDLGNFNPAVADHSTLWNVDELYWPGGGSPDPR